MRVLGLQTPLLKPGDDLPAIVLRAAQQVGGLRDGDVVVIASSAVATVQGRLKRLSGVRPSRRAKLLAKRSGLEPKFVELVLREADEVLGCGRGGLVTLKGRRLCVNAGIDSSNAPPGHVLLLPKKPDGVARSFLQAFKLAGASVGVIIADSHVQPLRMGTVGQALGVAGLEPVVDCRGQRDLFGKPLKMTFRAIADQLASAAQVVMGEAAERVPVVVVRGAGVELVERPKRSPKISPRRCVFFSRLKR